MNQFAAAFGGIQEARKEQQQQPQPEAAPTVTRRKAPHKAPAQAQTPPSLAKSRNPAYEPVKLFMHTEKRRKAERKWEDEGGRDLSSLIETLLTKYLGS